MAKRKVFVKTDLTTSKVEHSRDASGAVVIPLDVIPPKVTTVEFGRCTQGNSFNFAPWYGVGIDAVTYACQRQIERFIDKQDAELEVITVCTYCVNGLNCFLKYFSIRSAALSRELTLGDINHDVVDGFLQFLKDDGGSAVSQKNRYHRTKAVLKALCMRGLILEIMAGDEATFPRNPFPGANKTSKGERPLSLVQRKAFSVAVKTAVMPIFSDDVDPTAEVLAYALLVIALHTGRNTTPLLEMSANCLRSHPKDDTLFLVLYKRRGHSTSKVAIRNDSYGNLGIESMPTIRPTVARLIRRVIESSARLRDDAPEHVRDRVWLYKARAWGVGADAFGKITALTGFTLAKAIKVLVKQYKLVDADGKPLRLNVSRLRKTFVNRVFEILDADIVATAVAAGNTVGVTSVNYLRPGENAQKNWMFMGEILVQELLTNTIGATERTPMGRCSDNKTGEYAPKRDGTLCMSFLNCLRCRNYVVTADDLYRLFSFYFRILGERANMESKRWQRQFAHIPRLIERDVIDLGLSMGVFKQDIVDNERERARNDPHPFWRSDTILADLAGGAI